MKNVKRDVRGFTLVELLAVIVVLAIIMLIAVNAVLPRMNSARKQAFAIEANALMEAAQTYIVNTSLASAGEINTRCVTVETLRTEGYSELSSSYTGKVEILKGTGSRYYYKVYLQNGQFMVIGNGSTGTDADSFASEVIAEKHVEDYTEDNTQSKYWNADEYTSCSLKQ